MARVSGSSPASALDDARRIRCPLPSGVSASARRAPRPWCLVVRFCLVSCLAFTFSCQDPVGTTDGSPPVDDEFDGGSQVADQTPSTIQIQNLALLGKVWGFAKYHHPLVVGGNHNWDYELFRVVPAVLAASDRTAAAGAIVAWLDGLGAIPQCTSCAQPPGQAHLQPEIEWIDDPTHLGAELSNRLRSMHQNRPAVGGTDTSRSYRTSAIPTSRGRRYTVASLPPMQDTGCWPSSGSGTSSSTGSPIGTSWTRTGTVSWPSSSPSCWGR